MKTEDVACNVSKNITVIHVIQAAAKLLEPIYDRFQAAAN
jgi:hypothetical protein